MLFTEARTLMPKAELDMWEGYTKPLNISITPWPPIMARAIFMGEFAKIKPSTLKNSNHYAIQLCLQV